MIQERIVQFIEYKGFTKYKFYQMTKLSNGFLDKKGTIGADKCEIIYYCFPEINLEWLLTGNGSMLKSGVKKEVQGLDPPDAGKLALLERENAMQAKIIAGLEFQVATLEKELYVLKLTQGDPIVNEIVAKPAPELSK